MEFHSFTRLRTWIVVGLLWTTAGGVSAGVLDEARELIRDGRPEAAYSLLAPLEDARAGEPGYDHLLGIAALDSGKPGLAVFALERVVVQEPGNAQARAELARAYYQLQENQLAREELETVKAMAPPESVRQTIDRYLEAVDQRFEALRTSVHAYAEAGAGYDTNINSAADDDFFAFPGSGPFGPVTVPNVIPDENAPFATGALGAGVSHSLTPDVYLFGSGRLYGRNNLDGSELDELGTAADLGVRYFRGADALTATVSGDELRLDGTGYRSTGGLSLQWQRTLDARNQVTGFARFANLRYHVSPEYPGNPFNDADQRLFGLAWGHQLGGEGAPVLFLSGYVADEDERREVLTFVDGALEETPGLVRRDYWGLRAGGQYSLNGNVDLLGSVTAQYSDYEGIHPTYTDREREDDFYYLSVGAEWRLSREWTLKPRLTFARNISNVPLSDYDRTMLQFTARYLFR